MKKIFIIRCAMITKIIFTEQKEKNNETDYL